MPIASLGQGSPWIATIAIIATTALAAAAAIVSPSGAVALAVVFGAPLAALIALVPYRWAVTLLIFASGFTGVVLSVGLPFNLRPDVVLAVPVFACGVLHGKASRMAFWLRNPTVLLLAAFVALQFAVSLAFSPVLSKSLGVCAWFLLDLLIVLLALAGFEDDRQGLFLRVKLAASLVICSGLLAWVANAWLHATIGTSYDSADGLRTFGIAYEPNILAGTAAMWVVITVTAPGRLRYADRGLIAAALVVIPLTSTRTALFAIAAGLAVYWIGTPRLIHRAAVIVLALPGLVAVASMLSPGSVAGILGKLTNLSDATAVDRYTNWRTAFGDMQPASWVFGLGTNSYGQRHLEWTLVSKNVAGYLGSLPLQTVYDSGLVGAAILLAAAIVISSKGDRRRRLALLVTFLVVASATSPFFFSNWWLLIAVALARQGATPKRRSLGPSSSVPRFVWPPQAAPRYAPHA